MKHFFIYGCGTMIGLTPEQYESWRDEALDLFDAYSSDRYIFDFLFPARGEEHLSGKKLEAFIGREEQDKTPLNNDRSVFLRDRWDVHRADLLLCNLCGATKNEQSTGSKMEMAWAYDVETPVILIIEPDRSNPHEHLFIKCASIARVATVAEAVRLAVELLVPNKRRFKELERIFEERLPEVARRLSQNGQPITA